MRFRNENVLIPEPLFDGLSFTAVSASTISFNNGTRQLQYQINNGDWIDYDTADVSISLNANDLIKWKRKISTVIADIFGRFSMSGSLSVSGNIMSLLSNNYENMIDLTGWGGDVDNGIFKQLFLSCYALMDASGLILPATTTSNGCYMQIFRDCTNMVGGPLILANYIAPYACYRLFMNCTSLQSVKCLATGWSATGGILEWMTNVSSSGTFTKKAGVSWPSGVSGIPTGWTVVEE